MNNKLENNINNDAKKLADAAYKSIFSYFYNQAIVDTYNKELITILKSNSLSQSVKWSKIDDYLNKYFKKNGEFKPTQVVDTLFDKEIKDNFGINRNYFSHLENNVNNEKYLGVEDNDNFLFFDNLSFKNKMLLFNINWYSFFNKTIDEELKNALLKKFNIFNNEWNKSRNELLKKLIIEIKNENKEIKNGNLICKNEEWIISEKALSDLLKENANILNLNLIIEKEIENTNNSNENKYYKKISVKKFVISNCKNLSLENPQFNFNFEKNENNNFLVTIKPSIGLKHIRKIKIIDAFLGKSELMTINSLKEKYMMWQKNIKNNNLYWETIIHCLFVINNSLTKENQKNTKVKREIVEEIKKSNNDFIYKLINADKNRPKYKYEAYFKVGNEKLILSKKVMIWFIKYYWFIQNNNIELTKNDSIYNILKHEIPNYKDGVYSYKNRMEKKFNEKFNEKFNDENWKVINDQKYLSRYKFVKEKFEKIKKTKNLHELKKMTTTNIFRFYLGIIWTCNLTNKEKIKEFEDSNFFKEIYKSLLISKNLDEYFLSIETLINKIKEFCQENKCSTFFNLNDLKLTNYNNKKINFDDELIKINEKMFIFLDKNYKNNLDKLEIVKRKFLKISENKFGNSYEKGLNLLNSNQYFEYFGISIKDLSKFYKNKVDKLKNEGKEINYLFEVEKKDAKIKKMPNQILEEIVKNNISQENNIENKDKQITNYLSTINFLINKKFLDEVKPNNFELLFLNNLVYGNNFIVEKINTNFVLLNIDNNYKNDNKLAKYRNSLIHCNTFEILNNSNVIFNWDHAKKAIDNALQKNSNIYKINFYIYTKNIKKQSFIEIIDIKMTK